MYNNGDNANYGRGRRTNQKQKHILFAAMATNREILECRSCEPAMRHSRKAVWNILVAQLNKAGPKKDLTQWRKCWTDLRLNMRKKWDKSQNSSYVLTEYERRIITSCGMIECVDKNSEAEGNNGEDVSSFINFLNDVKEDLRDEESYPKHEETDEDYSNHNSQYFADSSEQIICDCEPEEISVKQEYEEEPTRLEEFREQEYQKEETGFEDFEEEKYKREVPIFEEFKEQEPTTFEEFKEHYVEYISDEESVIMIEDDIKSEQNSLSSYKPLEPVVVPEKKKSPSPKPTPVLPLPNNTISLKQSPELQDATLLAIQKMHRSLLKESKKQTSLLRRLVRGLERENS